MEFIKFAFGSITAGITSSLILAALLTFAYLIWRELMYMLVGWREAGRQGPVNCPMLDEDFEPGGPDDDDDFPGPMDQSCCCPACEKKKRKNPEGFDKVPDGSN